MGWKQKNDASLQSTIIILLLILYQSTKLLTRYIRTDRYPTQLANMSFDEILDLTADVFSPFYHILRVAPSITMPPHDDMSK